MSERLDGCPGSEEEEEEEEEHWTADPAKFSFFFEVWDPSPQRSNLPEASGTYDII